MCHLAMLQNIVSLFLRTVNGNASDLKCKTTLKENLNKSKKL